MIHHPVNKAERLRIKKKKDEQKKLPKENTKDKAGAIWRATKERDKAQELERDAADELIAALH